MKYNALISTAWDFVAFAVKVSAVQVLLNKVLSSQGNRDVVGIDECSKDRDGCVVLVVLKKSVYFRVQF